MKVTSVEESLDNRTKNFICGAVEGFYGRPWSTEQRKLLFSWLKKMGMNTYMYAPKDDCKHRAFWRELYSVEEADHMTGLIEAARECNIEFVFALSPGLDITFSSAKDVQALKRKLEQVAKFGCNAFALLFDDIDPELSETDKSVFQSSAGAQVSVSNEVYEYLGQPVFYFCPTEYCTSRALPNLPSSDYLNTIGSKLLPGIDILWTGSKVITKKISIPHLQEVSSVLRRPPVIWDNIHANDYDVRRLFLGPYDGRSPEIIPYLRGVLTNPNCEFETNYIPLHTLGQWSKSNSGGLKKDVISDGDRLSPVASVIKLETELEFVCDDDIPLRLDTRYQPRQALRTAINEWMYEVTRNRLPPPRLIAPSPPVQNLMPDNSNMHMTSPLMPVIPPVGAPDSILTCNAPELPEHLSQEEIVNESYMQPTMNPVNSLLIDTASSVDSESVSSAEPMECMPSPNALNETKCSLPENNSSDNLMQVELCSCDNLNNADKSGCDSNLCVLRQEQITHEDLCLLADLFYMPFEHGTQGVQLLQDLHWLKSNTHVLSNNNKSKEESQSEVTEWQERADGFITGVRKITEMTKRLYSIPNSSLAHDVFPYLWDLVGVLQTCSTYVAWLKFGKLPTVTSPGATACQTPTWCSAGYRDAFTSGDQEPWVFRGGLQGEFQNLLPIGTAHDLFLLRPPEVLITKVYTYRTYKHSDEAAVYNVCLKTCDDGMDGTEVFPEMPNLIGDRILGSMVTLSPEYSFVVEDDEGVCGYAVASNDAKVLQQKMELGWIPAMCEKYPKTDKSELSPSDEVILSFHAEQRKVPNSVHTTYPSVCRIDFIPERVVDYSVPKRLLACALSAVKASTSVGIHVEMNVGDKCMIDHYRRLGFFPISGPDYNMDEVVYLGRVV